MSHFSIHYHFALEDGSEESFELVLDEKTLELQTPDSGELPAWTELSFRQCQHCPLHQSTSPRCPAAVKLVGLVRGFARVLSYQRVHVGVHSAERTTIVDASAQEAVSSLMGLIMAVSGCPHTAFFRPMARFHLPGATTEETIYRATSMHMLAQYYVRLAGGALDLAFADLVRRYEAVQEVNRAFVTRLQAAADSDATVNALVVLDGWALSMPWAIEESLEGLKHLFEPYLNE